MAESTVQTEQPTLMLAAEIRQDKLLGYLRLRLNQDVFVQPIVEIQKQQQEWQEHLLHHDAAWPGTSNSTMTRIPRRRAYSTIVFMSAWVNFSTSLNAPFHNLG